MFNSEKALIAKLTQENKKLLKENAQLWNKNQELLSRISQLKQRIDELEKNNSILSKDYKGKYAASPILLKYIEVTKQNVGKKPNGRRYDGLYEFFSLLSLMGPHFFGMLTSSMMFPTYKTATMHTKRFLDFYDIKDSIFDGSVDNIQKIMKLFLPVNFEGKGVIMVDAAYVTPYVRIDKDGNVFGLLNPTHIDPALAEFFISNDDAFLDFIKSNLDEVITAEFGFTFAPLDPQFSPFPIARLLAFNF